LFSNGKITLGWGGVRFTDFFAILQEPDGAGAIPGLIGLKGVGLCLGSLGYQLFRSAGALGAFGDHQLRWWSVFFWYRHDGKLDSAISACCFNQSWRNGDYFNRFAEAMTMFGRYCCAACSTVAFITGCPWLEYSDGVVRRDCIAKLSFLSPRESWGLPITKVSSILTCVSICGLLRLIVKILQILESVRAIEK